MNGENLVFLIRVQLVRHSKLMLYDVRFHSGGIITL
jgi:hypothetical protein